MGGRVSCVSRGGMRGSQLDAQDLADLVQRLVDGPLQLVVLDGLVELALFAQEAGDAGTELALQRNELGIVLDGDGANERARRCRRGLGFFERCSSMSCLLRLDRNSSWLHTVSIAGRT